MDVEMTELYSTLSREVDPEMDRLIDVALTIHPEEMVATIGAFITAPDGTDVLVGHAALRPSAFADGTPALEVKRVIVLSEYRGRGISKLLMNELEVIARERGVASLILQTGSLQTEAITLYERIGYVAIERFGAYAPIPFFLCYGKRLD
jgi:GNAT superfamily N-acetyltransferase